MKMGKIARQKTFTFFQLQYLSNTYFFLPSRNCRKSSIDFAAAACLKYSFKTSGSFSSETASLIFSGTSPRYDSNSRIYEICPSVSPSSRPSASACSRSSLISSSNNIYCSSISRLAFTFLTAVCTRFTKLS